MPGKGTRRHGLHRLKPHDPPRRPLKPGRSLTGPGSAVGACGVAIVPRAEGTLRVIYKTPETHLQDRLLNRGDEFSLAIATAGRPWSFDEDGETFQVVVEARRVDLACLFDPMMAVHTFNADPQPPQITAVYESMLPRRPLCFVRADDPGAGGHRCAVGP